MKPTRHKAEDATRIERLRKRLDEWRRSRRKHARLPKELWSEAVDLAQAYGVEPVCGELRLEYAQLARRLPVTNNLDAKGMTDAEFLKVWVPPPSPVQSACENAQGPTVELRQHAGHTLTVRLTGSAGHDTPVLKMLADLWQVPA